MNLRLYLRGLGIGILVTAVIMGFARTDAAAMTDDEIRMKARSLGMIDNVVLSQLHTPDPLAEESLSTPLPSPALEPSPLAEPSPSEATEPTPSTEPSPEPSPEPTPEPLPSPSPALSSSPSPSPETTPLPEPTNGGAESDLISSAEVMIRINSGDDSFRVSTRLEEAGLVSTASEYNHYLMENGYSRILRVGNHFIPEGADYEKIALILTGRG